MATPLSIPSDLEQAFRQFVRDFQRVTARWIEACEETPDTVAAAREGLREYLAIPDDPDAYGVPRAQRLRDVFAFWRDRALSVPVSPSDRGAVPVLSFEAEARIADAHACRAPARFLPA